MAVRIEDGAANPLTSTNGALDINVKSSSGGIAVSNFPATQAVSAASLPLPTGAATAANQQTMGTAGSPSTQVASVQGVVGGTPQPISGTVAVSNLPTTQPISGTVAISNFPSTQPISAASLPLPSNAAQETGGNLASIASATTNGTQKSQLVNGSGIVADVSPKSTQGAEFLAVQQPKDSGRSKVILTLTKTTSITTEALVTLTQKKGDSTTTTGTSYTVTTGKTLRLQSLLLSATLTVAGITAVAIRLREGAASGGAVSVTSDIIAELEVSANVATIGVSGQQILTFPDGLELAGGQVIGISELATTVDAAVTIVLVGYEY
jgi:hypothetical protein